MNKLYTLSIALLGISAFAQQGQPAPYYNGFNFSQEGMNLKNALANKISSTHTNELSYQEAENAIKVADLEPGSNSNVLLLYGFSDNICPSSSADDNNHRRRNKNSDGAGSNCEWNREHTYAKSLGTPDLGETGPGADAHHLRSCDVDRNSMRGNLRFTSGSGNSANVGGGWYPGDEWKGDVARMIMYMYLRYGDRCLPRNAVIGPSPASDGNMVQLLLQWNAEDPVSQYEDNRNTYLGNAGNAFGQGNRNPFIDNPYLATLIWGGQPAQDRWGIMGTQDVFTANTTIYPNPANSSEVTVYSENMLDNIQLININGQIIQTINKPVQSSNKYTLGNLSSGFYMVRLMSGSASVVKKLIVN